MTQALHVVTDTEWIDHFSVRLDLGSMDDAENLDPEYGDIANYAIDANDPEIAAELEAAATEDEKVLHFPPF